MFLNELQLYSNLILKADLYLLLDGIMSSVVGAPRTKKDWSWNNPLAAIEKNFFWRIKLLRGMKFKFL